MKAEARVVITYKDMVELAKNKLGGSRVNDTMLLDFTEEINYDEDADEWVVSWELKGGNDE
jgi:hypothetical protein|tara:strand:+ start:457 stop:639 length:183 start_codon:yes stop_codon:yes gene_type:complete